MSIEIKVVGTDAREVELALKELSIAFGIRPVEPAETAIDEVDLDTLVALTKAKLETEGFEMVVRSVSDAPADPLDARPSRRGRKPKVSPEEARAALAETPEDPDQEPDQELDQKDQDVSEVEAEPETPAEETSAPGDTDLEALKAQTIKTLQALYFEPNGSDRVKEILRKHGDGAKLFSEIPPEKFPAIAAELG